MKFKAFKYRIYPTLEQKELIHQHFGSARWIYNYALNKKIIAYQTEKISLSRFDIQAEIPSLKKDEKTEWLKNVNSQTLQASLENLDKAYTKFFKEKKGFPNFKSKHDNTQSFSVPQNGKVNFEDSKLSLPKFKTDIDIVLHRKFEGKTKTVTISKTPTGKYFASVLVELNEEVLAIKVPIDENKAVGIDIGIKTFAVLSDGKNIENPRNLKRSLKRLKQRQRALSRKKKGSNNRNKAKIKLAIVHEKVSNQRLDFLHKTSKMIVDNYDTICLETLTAKNMMKNHKLAQALSDIAICKFNELLEYKAEWYGKNILRIGRFEPSSKLCTCGVINKELKLSDRVWTCKSCNTIHDRDVLASNNIKRMAFHSQNKIRVERSESTLGSYESR
jgi:putative transposase